MIWAQKGQYAWAYRRIPNSDLILIVRPRNKVGEQALRAIVEHPDEPL